MVKVGHIGTHLGSVCRDGLVLRYGTQRECFMDGLARRYSSDV